MTDSGRQICGGIEQNLPEAICKAYLAWGDVMRYRVTFKFPVTGHAGILVETPFGVGRETNKDSLQNDRK